MKRTLREYLKDILEASQHARRFVEGLTYEQFAADIEKVYAVTRALEIIGEAVKKIPASLRNGILRYLGAVLQVCAIFSFMTISVSTCGVFGWCFKTI